MKEVAIWSSVFGHCWVMTVKPNVGAATMADEQAMNVRPYLTLLTPLTVMDWRWERKPNGAFGLAYLKYTEEANDTIAVIKEWTAETIITKVVSHKDKVVQSTVEEINGIGEIPAVICYSQRSPVRGIGASDISDIAQAQRFLFNLTSEVEQSVRINGHPALVKTPDTEASAGAGAIVQMPDNLDPGLKPYMLSVSTDTDQIYNAIRHTVEAIDKMANVGSIRDNQAAVMSGVAREQEFQLLNAKLSEKADNLELCEEQIWQWYCLYQGKTWSGTIEYPSSFNIRDTDAEVERLVKAKQAATDPRVLRVIDHELLEALGEDPNMLGQEEYSPEDIPAEVPFDPHKMIDPQTGKEYYARTEAEHIMYADMGYVHESED
jgi:hypothetical protein